MDNAQKQYLYNVFSEIYIKLINAFRREKWGVFMALEQIAYVVSAVRRG